MLKPINIMEALPETLTTQFDFATTFTDKDEESHNFTIFNTAFFVSCLEQLFSSYQIRLDDTNPAAALVALFGIWKTNRSDAYARRAYALSLKYDPIYNYDRYETRDGSSETTHGESITRTHADTDTRTNANTDTLTYAGSESTSDGMYGANSAQPAPTDTTTKSFTNRTDTNAHTGTITDAHTGTITDAHSGKDSTEDGYELRAYGNIGVTQTSDMLDADYSMLKKDLALTAVCDFINMYAYYVEGLSL